MSDYDLHELADFTEKNPYPVMRVSKDGIVVYANDASMPVQIEAGCETGEKVSEEWLNTVNECLESGMAKVLTLQCLQLTIELTFIPVIDAEYVNIFGRDITEQKRFEDELILARDEALQAEKAKSSFLAMMSHEIRTPMNGVLGMVQVLLESKLDKKQHEVASIIKECGDSLVLVINDILDYSKIESNKLEIEATSFSVESCIKTTVQVAEFSAKKKKIDVFYELDPEAPSFIKGDPLRLKQILNNLLSNAIKFTSKGKIVVRTKVKPTKNGKVKMFFSVKDSGIGISEENIKKLFVPFSQLGPTTTRKFGGTGLGLTICKKLSQLMGGDIHIVSKEGKGSIFTFYVLTEAVDASEVETDLEDQVKEISFNKDDLSILVAEDNLVNQQLVKEVFRLLNLNYSLAKNGLEAVESTRKNKYDLILMDMQMPEMGGIEATEIICKEFGKEKPMIVAMTANAVGDAKDECMAAGMDGFITKPINIAELKKFLASVLEAKQSKGESKIDDTSENKGTVVAENVEVNQKEELFAEITTEVFSDKIFVENYMGDASIIKTALEAFFEEQEKALPELENAINSENADLSGQWAHRMKGSLSSVGGLRTVELAYWIEQKGKEGSIEGMSYALQELQEACKQLELVLKKYLDELEKENAA